MFPVLRGHLSAWVTAAFAALLLVVTLSDRGPGAGVATALVLLAALAVLAVFFATEHAVHRGKH